MRNIVYYSYKHHDEVMLQILNYIELSILAICINLDKCETPIVNTSRPVY